MNQINIQNMYLHEDIHVLYMNQNTQLHWGFQLIYIVH